MRAEPGPRPPAAPHRVPLEAGRLRLRPTVTADGPALIEAVRESVAELAPWMPWAHEGYGAADSQRYLQPLAENWVRGEEYAFVIEDAAGGRLLGACGLNQPNRAHRFMNLGYWVRTGATRGGVASAATRRLAQWAFGALTLARLEIVVDVRNLASLRVAEKSGAHREGVLRGRIDGPGGPQDAVMFSLIPEDLSTDTGEARRP